MAKRGPKTEAVKVKRLRGSQEQQKDDVRAAKRPTPKKFGTPAKVKNIKRICKTKIPGFDPWRCPGDAHFDAKKARKAVEFFHDQLSHVKGELARHPLNLGEWEQAVIGNIFGWIRPDGTRRFREVFVFVPRKNGKTTLAAGIIVYGLFEDGEHQAECYGCASEYRQASLVFEQVRGMVMQNPALAAQCKIYNGQSKAVQLQKDWSTYRPISSTWEAAHGFNSHLICIDELHTIADRELVDALVTSTGARRQPLVVMITTSDFQRESICNEKYDYASQVRDGIIEDPSFLPVIYEAQLGDDYMDPKVWAKANPNLGVSVYRDYFERQAKRAQETPGYLNNFLRLHLNIRTEADVRFFDMAKWQECEGKLDLASLRGKPCWAGLDLSSTGDITALCLYFPHNHALLPWFWIPKENAIKREKKDKVPYLVWAKKGLLEMTPGNVVDYDTIRRRVNEVGKVYNIKEIAIDRWNSTQMQAQLDGDGFNVVQFGQGFASMSAPTKEIEKLVLSKELVHGGNPILRWMAGNASAEIDAAGNVKLSKKRSHQKIDGVIAAIMAIGRAMQDPQKKSVYKERGLLRI